MQSVAIKISISSVLPGIKIFLSLDTGEKQVSTVFKSARNLGMVILPSTVPVISAVFKLYLFFTYTLTFL